MATNKRFDIHRASASVASFTALMLRPAATILLTVVSRLFAAAVIIVFTLAIIVIALILDKRQPRRTFRHQTLQAQGSRVTGVCGGLQLSSVAPSSRNVSL